MLAGAETPGLHAASDAERQTVTVDAADPRLEPTHVPALAEELLVHVEP